MGENSATASNGSPVDCLIVDPNCVTSGGRLACASANRFCTFTWSVLTSVSESNVTVSCVVLSLAFVDCMYNMLSTPFICCSIGLATACSMVMASAPGYVVATMIWGGTISGNCASGSPRMETTPTITVMMAMTIATIGRSTKNRATRSAPDLREGPGRDDAALSDGRRRADDDLLAGLDAVLDDLEVADAIPDRDRSHDHLVVRAEHLYLITALEIGDRPLGNNERAADAVGDGAHAPVLTRPKDVAWIRECRHEPDGASATVHFPVRGDESALMLESTPIAQRERESGARIPRLFPVGMGRVDRPRHPKIFRLAHRKVGLDRRHLRHRGQERGRPDEVADLCGRDRCDAIDERGHTGELDVQSRGLRPGFEGLHLRQRRAVRLDLRIELALRDRLLLGERRVALDVAGALGQLRLRLCHLRPRLVQYRVEGPRVDFEEHISFAHARAFAIVAFDEIAADLWTDLRVDVSIERRDPLTGNGHVPFGDGGDLDFERRGRSRRRPGARTAGGEGAHRDGSGDAADESPHDPMFHTYPL